VKDESIEPLNKTVRPSVYNPQSAGALSILLLNDELGTKFRFDTDKQNGQLKASSHHLPTTSSSPPL